MSNEPPIRLVLAADSNYAMPMAVAMCSAAANCAENRELEVFVIHDSISGGLAKRVESSLASVRRHASLNWLSVPNGSISGLRVIHGHMNPLIYARLLIPTLLPSDCNRAIYIDSDVVVEGDISDLWDIPLASKSVAAVRDRIGTVGSSGGLANYEELGINPASPYFNSGLLLLDVARWRNLDISSKVFSYLRTHAAHLQMGDQDGLNAVLHDDWIELPSRWNQQIIPLALRRGRESVALPHREEGGVLHYISGEKPWLPNCRYDEKKFFFKYLDKTSWSGWRVSKWREYSRRFVLAVGAIKRRAYKAIGG